MNENPCSNQLIHVLFEHGFELENTLNEPCIICMTLYAESWSFRGCIFCSRKRCERHNVMTFESLQSTPFCLEKSKNKV